MAISVCVSRCQILFKFNANARSCGLVKLNSAQLKLVSSLEKYLHRNLLTAFARFLGVKILRWNMFTVLGSGYGSTSCSTPVITLCIGERQRRQTTAKKAEEYTK